MANGKTVEDKSSIRKVSFSTKIIRIYVWVHKHQWWRQNLSIPSIRHYVDLPHPPSVRSCKMTAKRPQPQYHQQHASQTYYHKQKHLEAKILSKPGLVKHLATCSVTPTGMSCVVRRETLLVWTPARNLKCFDCYLVVIFSRMNQVLQEANREQQQPKCTHQLTPLDLCLPVWSHLCHYFMLVIFPY